MMTLVYYLNVNHVPLLHSVQHRYMLFAGQRDIDTSDIGQCDIDILDIGQCDIDTSDTSQCNSDTSHKGERNLDISDIDLDQYDI